jgi:hypothetical protein
MDTVREEQKREKKYSIHMKIIQQKSRYEPVNKLKGYERTYDFFDETGGLCWTCDVYGECIKSPTVYNSTTDGNQEFKMVAKGKILNAIYFLEDKQGAIFSSITRKGIGFRWKILGENNQEMARIIDPASRKEAFFRDILNALPEGYAVVLDEDLIATIKKERLSKRIKPKHRNILGRFFEKIIEPSGLTLRLEQYYSSSFDIRILLAGMTLLQVHDITGVNRQ